ncbi:MAG: phytoene desaturase family protein, partial [Anaerolineales bacterium]
MVIPSLHDPANAPDGSQVLSVTMQYAPYRLAGSSWEHDREQLGDRIVAAIAEHAPELPELILHRQVITPLDLERDYRLPEGNPNHGEMGLDQLLSLRPIPGYARYRSPVPGLYFSGAGAHPGGGLTGAPGYNAAREIRLDLNRRRRLRRFPGR